MAATLRLADVRLPAGVTLVVSPRGLIGRWQAHNETPSDEQPSGHTTPYRLSSANPVRWSPVSAPARQPRHLTGQQPDSERQRERIPLAGANPHGATAATQALRVGPDGVRRSSVSAKN
jgi:hypothetical protein